MLNISHFGEYTATCASVPDGNGMSLTKFGLSIPLSLRFGHQQEFALGTSCYLMVIPRPEQNVIHLCHMRLVSMTGNGIEGHFRRITDFHISCWRLFKCSKQLFIFFMDEGQVALKWHNTTLHTRTQRHLRDIAIRWCGNGGFAQIKLCDLKL